MPRSILALAFFAAALSAQDSRPTAPKAAPAVAKPAFANPSCPIMGRETSAALYVDTDYGRIYTCCLPCNKKIRAAPETAYKAAYPKTEKAANAVCPVSGEKIGADPATIVLQGREISLSSKDHVKAARENAQITLAKATDPALKDVGNTIDPTNGKPVVANAFVIVGEHLIRLSSSAAAEEVRKNPAAALAKAKASAAEKPASKPAAPKPVDRRDG
jgi:hypothetical protein